MGFAPIERAVETIAQGGIVVVVDGEDRENEGDLIMAAEAATPEKIAFFLAHTSGVICVPLTAERLEELDLPLMVVANTESQRTAFTVSVDARFGTTTGISASDRATTVRALIDPGTKPHDLNRPGHIFPLRYRPGGVLKRAGHTEAAVDLARMAGMTPAGVLCEVVSEDKSQMARLPELEAFAELHGMPIISIGDLVRYRHRNERLVRRIAGPVRIPSEWGQFSGYAYESVLDGEEHLAIVKGEVAGRENVLVRVHSECLTGDVFGSLRCDCGSQLHSALKFISDEGAGVVVYLRGHEGRGIGLAHKLRAYSLQEQGHDTVDANLELGLPVDSREYGIGAQILVDLGVTTMRVMTNNPMKYTGLDGYGLDIVGRVPLNTEPNAENHAYLMTKRDRLGHLLTGLDGRFGSLANGDGLVIGDCLVNPDSGAVASNGSSDKTGSISGQSESADLSKSAELETD
ncbi:MAG: bifunctional 3,4-dihydroxy-2-butanone-4-phosphate synthase/GTP cyclohydrolase II [Acidimicrobiales bacterium]